MPHSTVLKFESHDFREKKTYHSLANLRKMEGFITGGNGGVSRGGGRLMESISGRSTTVGGGDRRSIGSEVGGDGREDMNVGVWLWRWAYQQHVRVKKDA